MEKFKKYVQFPALVLLIIGLIAFGVYLYMTILINAQESSSSMYLNEITDQTSRAVLLQIQADSKIPNMISTIISGRGTLLLDEILPILQEETTRNKFVYMGLVLNDKTAYVYNSTGNLVNNFTFDIDKYLALSESGQEAVVDDVLTNSSTYVNSYISCIRLDGKVAGIVFAIRDTESLSKLVKLTTFDGGGYSYVVKSTGEYVMSSSNSQSDIQPKNIFELSYEDPAMLITMINNMQNGKSGTINGKIEGEKRIMTYRPIGLNDWYMINVVFPSVVNWIFLRTIIILSSAVAVIFLLVVILFILIMGKNKEAIVQLAYFDKLTGIYNRSKFVKEVAEILKLNGTNFAIVQMNLNNFKSINEMFSYDEGDSLLKHISKTLSEALIHDEIVARGNADNFYMLLEYSNELSLTRRLDMIMYHISEYSELRHINYNITVYCGVYKLSPSDIKLNINSIIDRAALALSDVKGQHSNSIGFFDQEAYKKLLAKNEIANEMNRAINNEEFEVYLQPKYDAVYEKIVGAEALIRWNHPEKGLMSPGEFIPIFEENGFIVELDLYVLDKVCRQQREWLDQGLKAFQISVNQSRLLLYQSSYIDRLNAIIRKHGIPTDIIDLEITETLILGNKTVLINILDKLHELGFTISMDDFGSGYSSLNVLKDIPIDIIKLDKEFFEEATDTKRGREIIASIVEMAKKIQILTISEGIERREQVDFLKEIGCDIVQGYYFAKPMPIRDFEKLAYPDKIEK
jgi:diguanylate cyclase (GGDEF)-like protein